MANMTGNPRTSRRLLAAAILILLILGLLPVRLTSWAGWLGGVVSVLVAPVSHPSARIARWLAPASPRGAEPEEVTHLADEKEQILRLYRAEREEVSRLRLLIADLQAGQALYPEARVSQLTAQVISTSSDRASTVFRIRAGRSSGVYRGAVATARGVQLIGRVERVMERVAEIRPITDSAGQQIQAVIMLGDLTDGPSCLLRATGSGTLTGPVEDVGGLEAAPVLEQGMLVRLRDPEWPRSAQMLLIGRIESIDPAPSQPLRRIITVRPTLQLDRTSDVVLRLTSDERTNADRQGRDE